MYFFNKFNINAPKFQKKVIAIFEPPKLKLKLSLMCFKSPLSHVWSHFLIFRVFFWLILSNQNEKCVERVLGKILNKFGLEKTEAEESTEEAGSFNCGAGEKIVSTTSNKVM